MEKTTQDSDFPVLPEHVRLAWRAFWVPFGVMALGLVVFRIAVTQNSNLFQIVGACLGIVEFLGMMISFGRFHTARCPECSERLAQGWDSKAQRSDGIFTCQKCKKSWKTDATWRID